MDWQILDGVILFVYKMTVDESFIESWITTEGDNWTYIPSPTVGDTKGSTLHPMHRQYLLTVLGHSVFLLTSDCRFKTQDV